MQTANHTIEKQGYADINSKRVDEQEEGAWLGELSLQTVGQVARARTICYLVALRRRLETPRVAVGRGRGAEDRAEARDAYLSSSILSGSTPPTLLLIPFTAHQAPVPPPAASLVVRCPI